MTNTPTPEVTPRRRRRAVDVDAAPTAAEQAATAQQPVPQPSPQPVPQSSPETGEAPNGALGYVHVKRTAYGEDSFAAGRDDTETVRVPVFHSAPARVRVSGGATQNLGDYNSARVDVSVDMPCLPEATEIQRVYEMLSGQVDEMIRRELQIATGQGGQPDAPAPAPQPGPQQGQTGFGQQPSGHQPSGMNPHWHAGGAHHGPF